MPNSSPSVDSLGLAARRVAADILDGVLRRRLSLDEQFEGGAAHPGLSGLEDRDRALMRMIVSTVLRRLGSLRIVLGRCLDKGVPVEAPRVEIALLIGAAQMLWLNVPDHAAVDLAVRLVQADRRGARYAGLVNAVLRRVAREAADLLPADDAADLPAWLFARWAACYGGDTAHAIARALRHPPALDLTVRNGPETWAARLHGEVMPTGTVRAQAQGSVSRLPGYAEGAWWVQDAAAALPARLLGDLRGRRVLDVCAAPGGKTAQLAGAGGEVTALDRSPGRIRRLEANLDRLGLAASIVEADVTQWSGGLFDAVLLDAPCSSSGTLRRHPDVAVLKTAADVAALAEAQHRLLDSCANLVRPGGMLVYCVCSLEPEEGEAQIAALLARNADLRRAPIDAEDVSGCAEFVTADGDLRTLPCHWPSDDPRRAGLDGFFAARLVRRP